MKYFFHHKIFATSLIAVILLISLVWSFWKLNSLAVSLRTKLNEIHAEVFFAEHERKAIRLAEATMGERSDDLARINKVLINKEKPVDFVEDLEGLAKASGNLFVIDLDENKSGESKDLFFRLAVDGTEKSVMRYLKALELMPYKISIKELALQQIDSGKTTHRLSLLISAETL
ncbi:MAG: hypothetical protein Q8R29_01450 [bacterium]|nr:hypothetical protein [bacterium]